MIILGIVAYTVFYFTLGNTDKYDIASKHDVRFVLNWCELGDERIESVVHSYTSRRSFTGDHLDAYAIKITGVSVAELDNPKHDYIKWTRGDELEGILKQAVDLVSSFASLDKLSWFPSKKALSSTEIYVNPGSILLHGERVTSANLIFAIPAENMIYYASIKI